MDLGTLWVGLSTFVAGGLLGAIAGVYGTRKESQDRQAALALEREKFEYERDKRLRQSQRESIQEAKHALAEMSEFLYDAFNHDRNRLEAVVDGFHEVRIHYGGVTQAVHRLRDHDLSDEATALDDAVTAFLVAAKDLSDETYRGWVDASMSADRTLDARQPRIS